MGNDNYYQPSLKFDAGYYFSELYESITKMEGVCRFMEKSQNEMGLDIQSEMNDVYAMDFKGVNGLGLEIMERASKNLMEEYSLCYSILNQTIEAFVDYCLRKKPQLLIEFDSEKFKVQNFLKAVGDGNASKPSHILDSVIAEFLEEFEEDQLSTRMYKCFRLFGETIKPRAHARLLSTQALYNLCLFEPRKVAFDRKAIKDFSKVIHTLELFINRQLLDRKIGEFAA
ncbi:hypothetical protein [Persicobacter diffluens]|uniref:Uncharacterized protein n=1 Tax=Persicobacter diffluens TaxID=981 RepID=A0AAN4W3H7_9BACT|nr:hypothetical protein PEDI_45150 [Persicobacter diffluens]